MKVHFAAGTHAELFAGDWWNLDFHPFPGVDQTLDLLEPFPPEIDQIEVAYVGHFLEHISPDEGIAFLSRVRARMQPSGQIVVVGPDVEKGLDWYKRRKIGKDLWAAIQKHGEVTDHNRAGVHVWDCSGPRVAEQLALAGWSKVQEHDISRFRSILPGVPCISDAGWQFLVTAVSDVL